MMDSIGESDRQGWSIQVEECKATTILSAEKHTKYIQCLWLFTELMKPCSDWATRRLGGCYINALVALDRRSAWTIAYTQHVSQGRMANSDNDINRVPERVVNTGLTE